MARISIIMPTLNEAQGIGETLAPLQEWRGAGHEIIVVDGHSTDVTVSIAAKLSDRCLTAGPGRAAQLNAGAQAAAGDVLLFLHADTALPPGALAAIQRLQCESVDFWGRFDVTLADRGAAFRVIETMMNLRSRLTGVATGDQAMFVTRGLFDRVGGVPPIELMEDVALSKRLCRESRPCCLRLRARTSARRWRRAGVCRTVATMWGLRLAYFIGVAPARLRAFYDRDHVDG